MKHSIITRSVLLLALVCACLSLASCTGTQAEKEAQLSKYANIALNAGEVFGAVNPKQAELIRKHGSLVTNALTGGGIKLEDVSNAAVEIAVAKGKLTQAQADQLKAAGEVPLSPANPLLPAPDAPPAVLLTATK